MAVNLINNEQIHVNQDGSDITLDIQDEALKNKNAVVGSIRSKNMFNKNNVTQKFIIISDGTYYRDNNYNTSDYIEVKPTQEYTYSRASSGGSSAGVAFYDNNKNFISLTSWSSYTSNTSITFQTTNNTYYVRICDLNTLLNSMQLEEGNIATQYFPYQELNAQNIGNYWQDKSSSITIKDNKVQSQRTKLFVNTAMRLVFLQVYYADTLNVGTTTDIIEFPLEYKPAFLNSDDLWIPMQYSNGGNSPTTRGQLNFDSSKCFIDLLCIDVAASSAYGNIVYPY